MDNHNSLPSNVYRIGVGASSIPQPAPTFGPKRALARGIDTVLGDDVRELNRDELALRFAWNLGTNCATPSDDPLIRAFERQFSRAYPCVWASLLYDPYDMGAMLAYAKEFKAFLATCDSRPMHTINRAICSTASTLEIVRLTSEHCPRPTPDARFTMADAFAQAADSSECSDTVLVASDSNQPAPRRTVQPIRVVPESATPKE